MIIDVDIVSGVPTWTNPRVLLDLPTSVFEPAWSPLGDRVAFIRDGKTIAVISPSGGAPTDVYTSPPGTPGMLYTLAWNRDGSLIAFGERDSTDTSIIRAVNVATGEVTTLLDAQLSGPIAEGEPIFGLDWARVSDVLAFHTAFNPREIYTLQIPGGTPTFVVDGQGPTWSPNDAEIIFEDRNGRLSRVNVATRVVTRFGNTIGMFPDRRRF
jgi:hypothetical protein